MFFIRFIRLGSHGLTLATVARLPETFDYLQPNRPFDVWDTEPFCDGREVFKFSLQRHEERESSPEGHVEAKANFLERLRWQRKQSGDKGASGARSARRQETETKEKCEPTPEIKTGRGSLRESLKIHK